MRVLPTLRNSVVLIAMFLGMPVEDLSAQAPASSQALARARAATVLIEVEGISGKSQGSGAVLTDNGIIVTNAHVIEGARRVSVKFATTGQVFEAIGAIDYDAKLDLALVVVAGFGLKTVPLGNSDSVAVGQRLFGIGAPMGLETSVTDGILSAVRVDAGVQRFQVSVPLSHGSSGGPIVNESGEMIAVAVSGIRGQGAENLNFAVPVNYVRGKLGVVAQRAPTPFDQLAYAPTMAAITSETAAGASSVPIVNRNLDLDFTSLDDVVLLAEEKGDGQLRMRIQTSYGVSNTPDGGRVLERIQVTRYRNQGLVASVQLAEDEMRTVFTVGGMNRSSTFFQRRPLAATEQSVRWELHIEGSRYKYLSSLGKRDGDAASGIFPSELVGAVTAALPDSIGGETRVWVLDPSTNRSQEMVLRVESQGRREIPVPRDGGKCTFGTATTKQSVDVLRVSRRIGTETEQITLLARRPHLLLTESLVCVSAPALRGR